MSLYFDLVPRRKITFCDRNHRLSSAIFHHGETALRNHFKTVVRKNKRWFKADDARISMCLGTVEIFTFYFFLKSNFFLI